MFKFSAVHYYVVCTLTCTEYVWAHVSTEYEVLRTGGGITEGSVQQAQALNSNVHSIPLHTTHRVLVKLLYAIMYAQGYVGQTLTLQLTAGGVSTSSIVN